MTEWSDTLCSHLNLTMLTTTTTLPATPPTPRSAYLDAKVQLFIVLIGKVTLLNTVVTSLSAPQLFH